MPQLCFAKPRRKPKMALQISRKVSFLKNSPNFHLQEKEFSQNNQYLFRQEHSGERMKTGVEAV